MKTKSHARAADKKGFSVALPIALTKQIQAIAKKESRSRNRQIEVLLEKAVKEYEASLRGEEKSA